MSSSAANVDGLRAAPALCLACAVLSSTSHAVETGLQTNSGVFGRFEADLLSEPEALDRSFQDWGTGFEEGERQWALAVAELGLRYRGFEISFQQRAHLDLRINEEAAELYGRIARKEALVPGEVVPMDIQVETFTAEGLRIGYRTGNLDWSINGGVTYLDAKQLISGDIQGDITATGARDYDLNLEVDYSYYEDAIFDRPLQTEPEGQGWAVDLGGSWRIDEHWQVSASVEDLFARIYWEDAPFTRARGHTDRKTYDEDGYAVFQPLISGREGFRSRYVQEPGARYRARIQYRQGSWTAAMHGRRQFGYSLGGFGLGFLTAGGQSLDLIYWPQLESTALQYGIGRVQAQLSIDTGDWEEARSVALSLRYGL
ncbi:TonB-dependent receptor [Proteobacteria bacterium 005FR1]|nr:TonB-dependent receptor [Proteobacteria bacterium 005FR1]